MAGASPARSRFAEFGVEPGASLNRPALIMFRVVVSLLAIAAGVALLLRANPTAPLTDSPLKPRNGAVGERPGVLIKPR